MFKSFFLRGAFKWGRLSLISVTLFWLFSCALTPHLNESKSLRLIENVPFFPQKAYQCGPASLAGVMNYWGVHATREDIAAEIYSRSAKGTLNLDMILYARGKGLRATHYKGFFEDIKSKIDLGYPVIVLVDLGFWVYQQNHFMVVVGYDENGIIANSGRERLKPISLKNFIKSWKKTNFWTLLVTPQR
ncbi:MAG: C39 family peptidase [Thermodesulfobacteriota bacterium]|nr:C39 family peptidase [Thermodesulfobacteriota bacterium]